MYTINIPPFKFKWCKSHYFCTQQYFLEIESFSTQWCNGMVLPRKRKFWDTILSCQTISSRSLKKKSKLIFIHFEKWDTCTVFRSGWCHALRKMIRLHLIVLCEIGKRHTLSKSMTRENRHPDLNKSYKIFIKYRWTHALTYFVNKNVHFSSRYKIAKNTMVLLY